MPLKAIALVVILGATLVLFMAVRKDNRAEAAAGNCYASAQGPTAPTLCQ